MDKLLHVVLVDDDEDEFFLLKEMIRSVPREDALGSFKLDWISSYDEAIAAYAGCRYDIFLVDYYLGTRNGLDFLRNVNFSECQSPIILLTGLNRYDVDMAAMQLGAFDYLVKSEVTYSLLERTIRYALERKQVERDLAKLLLERTRDLQLLEKQARELRELHKATTCLLKTLDLNTLMGQILDSAQGAVPEADESWLHLTDQPENDLNKLPPIEFEDRRIQKIDWRMNLNHPLFCVYKGQPLLINDTTSEISNFSVTQDEIPPQLIRSLISTPLMLGEQSIGALSLGANLPNVFDADDLQLLTSLANTATSAIHNAILHTQVENLAIHDPLTGQLNRRALFEQGQKEVERFQRSGLPLALIIFDLDHFKLVNDTYGHNIGDQVLTAAVARCASIIRRVDILGRYGGDEFVVILPGAGPEMVIGISERIRKALSETPVETTAGPVKVSISIGVAMAAKDTQNLSSLIRYADQALYRAKQNGRDSICIADSISNVEEE